MPLQEDRKQVDTVLELVDVAEQELQRQHSQGSKGNCAGVLLVLLIANGACVSCAGTDSEAPEAVKRGS